MVRSYKLKVYANKTKLQKLESLLVFSQQEVQQKIDLFWDLTDFRHSKPPKEYRTGSRIINDSSCKAWNIVKIAKKLKLDKPVYKGNEFDLNESTVRCIDPETKEFDFWVKMSCLDKGNRLALPCKKTGILNKALSRGALKKSCKIWKSKKGIYYLIVFVETPLVTKENTKTLGIDTGMIHPVATSNGEFFGDALKPLRIRTKHRKYQQASPYKQGLNHVAKELVQANPNTNFVLEDLKFKGKKGSSKEFRRRNNNWSYRHLGHRLEQLGELEGFKVSYVNPAYTSQTCPECLSVAKGNRDGESFLCLKCGYTNHADTLGAINILGRVPGDLSVPQTLRMT